MLEAILQRRSIRKYTEQPVEEEKLQEVLEAARLAPSWGNWQCWKIIVIRNSETKEALAECLLGGKEFATNPARKATATAPIVLVACADPQLSGEVYGMHYYLVDIGILMDHIMLTAASLGLGTCFVGEFDELRVKEILGVPENIRVVAITPLGYPFRIPDPRPRKELKDIVMEKRWQG